jgi:thiaminase/transcriptional activator TenA
VAAFTEKLREAAAPIWAAQLEHPFVRGIGEGTLEAGRFRHYVRQDYLFLVDYTRLLALAAARAPGLELLERFTELARSIVNEEMALHRSYAAEWGVSAAELEAERPTATTRGYTDFLLRTAALGDYGELVAALLPCMWGYSDVGRALAERGKPDDDLYARWIDTYADEDFARLAGWGREACDAAAAETGPAGRGRMREAFPTCARYELAFWEASWREEPPLLETP